MNLDLWSFYETQNMKLFSSLIVDPESAVLGYPEEKQVPMTADHRSICKFETPTDPNYAVLRNALISTVERITAKIPGKKQKQNREQNHEKNRNLKKYLGVSDILDDDLVSVSEARMKGSCEWILNKASYKKWRDGQCGDNRTLWIKGKPATGKSVLAGYVVDQLEKSGHSYSYFFFKHSDKSKSSLDRCFRSLAFQMAVSNPEACEAVLAMQADGVSLDRLDDRTLWRILFVQGIFQTTMSRHYWVFDALDECSNHLELFHAIILSIGEAIPLRILFTSRDTVHFDQDFSTTSSYPIHSLNISTTDTESDLRLLVERSTQSLAAVDPDEHVALAEKILRKSKGSFLWTILVLKELIRCHSKKAIDQVLEDVPRGMEPLYKRILDSMSQAIHGKRLTKTILMWVVCAVRPMTISELDGALTLEIDDSFPRLEESISALCGQLVVTDKYGNVKLVHETAREFLLTSGIESEFCINQIEAHTRMAQICLTYLSGDEMKPPRSNRRRPSVALLNKRQDFAIYACTSFSYHLSRADPFTGDTFQLVEQFLKLNVLTWIGAIAESQNLNHLTRASKRLKAYANGCAAKHSPLDPRIQSLRQWTTDLARIPAMFANALTLSPSAIYTCIPPFCPTESMIHKSGASSRRIGVFGTLKKEWDDRLMCIDFGQSQPKALRYGDEFLAVGLSSGNVTLYNATSYQEYKVLKHGEAVQFVAFKPKTDLIATCGMKMIKVWDTQSGQIVHQFASPPRPLGMEIDGNVLLVASRNNYIMTWDLGPGMRVEPMQMPWSDSDTLEATKSSAGGTPCALALSSSHKMLAVAYSGKPITLWNLEEDVYAGSCGKKLSSGETSTHVVVSLVFNPNPDIRLLAVTYLDGDLALLDPFLDRQLECSRANCQALAASPNGRFLAASGANGIVNVYKFDSFNLLYRVKSSNFFIKQLAFSKDSMLLADIRGSQCTVWEPEALLRESLGDDSSGNTFNSVVETVSVEAKASITAMTVHHTFEVIFCGKDDGSVSLYKRETGANLRTLYSHKSSIRLLEWAQERSALLSVDTSNGISLHRVQKSTEKGWLSDPVEIFKSRLDSKEAIIDVLLSEKLGRLLISTRESDHMFSLGSGRYERERKPNQTTEIRKWLPHPWSPLHLVCVDGIEVRTYCWDDWSQVSSVSLPMGSSVELKNAILYCIGKKHRIMIDSMRPSNSVKSSRIAIIDASFLASGNKDNSSSQEKKDVVLTINQSSGENDSNTAMVLAPATALRPQIIQFQLGIAHVIGIHESGRLVFLNRSFWVCSIDLGSSALENTQYKSSASVEVTEHFFVPYDWFAGKKNIVCALVKRDILLTRGGDLVVIRGGLEDAERQYVE